MCRQFNFPYEQLQFTGGRLKSTVTAWTKEKINTLQNGPTPVVGSFSWDIA